MIEISNAPDCSFYFQQVTTGRTVDPTNWSSLSGAGLYAYDLNECSVEIDTAIGFAYAQLVKSVTTAGVYFCNCDHAGAALHVDLFYDKASGLLTGAGGVPVRYYIRYPDLGVISASSKGVVAERIVDGSGSTLVGFRQDAFAYANNANVDLPYNCGIVEVKSNTSPVKLRIKNTDIRAGHSFKVSVEGYGSAISVRDELDTYDVVSSGIINSVGEWSVLFLTGGAAIVRKLA